MGKCIIYAFLSLMICLSSLEAYNKCIAGQLKINETGAVFGCGSVCVLSGHFGKHYVQKDSGCKTGWRCYCKG